MEKSKELFQRHSHCIYNFSNIASMLTSNGSFVQIHNFVNDSSRANLSLFVEIC